MGVQLHRMLFGLAGIGNNLSSGIRDGTFHILKLPYFFWLSFLRSVSERGLWQLVECRREVDVHLEKDLGLLKY